MIPNTMRWLKSYFAPLREPQHEYKQQTTILPRRVETAPAAMIHFGLDPGKLVCWLGGEYIGARQEVNHTLAAAKDHVSTDDFNHMKRILSDGSPFELTFDKPLSNKSMMIKQGNSKSFNKNPELVLKKMKKEERYSHVLPLDLFRCRRRGCLRFQRRGHGCRDL